MGYYPQYIPFISRLFIPHLLTVYPNFQRDIQVPITHEINYHTLRIMGSQVTGALEIQKNPAKKQSQTMSNMSGVQAFLG